MWGVWTVSEVPDDSSDAVTTVHVAPLFGTEHELTEFCWCQPDIEEDGLVVHHEDN